MFEIAAVFDNQTLCMALGVVVVIAIAIHHWIRDRREKDKLYPPMAPSGMWENVQAMSGNDNPWFLWRTGMSMGTSAYRLRLPATGAPMTVIVSDHKLARDILADKHTVKPLSMYRSFNYATNGIGSLFTSNGSYWHVRRKGIAPGFSSNHVQRMNDVALAKTDQWIEQRLRPLIDEGKSFDVGDEMIDLLLCAIAETAFQYKLSPSEVTMFKLESKLVLRDLVYKVSLNPLREVFGFLLPEHRRAKLAAKRMQALSLKVIRAYRKLENPLKGTIIDLICSNPCYKDDMERTADVSALFIAGHDTTAYSLAWTLKELAKHPDFQAELRQSIQDVKEGEAPNQLESVRNTIRESIRLHPVSAAGSGRTVGRDFYTKDGKLIPAGSITISSYISMLRDPVVFGEDYDQFKPSRWDKSNVTPEMNLAFMPFAVGRQNCVGQPLAQAELHCILPRIISQFELTLEEEGTTEWFLTLKPAGAMLKAKPAVQA